MIQTKKFAGPDDVHLTKSSLLAILSLNYDMPERNGEVWVIKSELRDRLIHCGVDSSLESIHVASAIKNYSKGVGG